MRLSGRVFGPIAATLLLAAAPPQVDPVPAEIEAALAVLREAWRDVGRAEMRRGTRFEYRDGAILLGSDRLAQLRRSLDNPNGALLAFLLAHEAWHSVQYARHQPLEIERMKADRMLECEADFMGAAAARRALARRGVPVPELRTAQLAIGRYVAANTQVYARATAYPSAELRVQTIAMGWTQAANPALLRSLSAESPIPADEGARATEICRIVTHGGDSSTGMLDVDWRMGEYIRSAPQAQFTQTLTVRNDSKRPITLSFVVLGKFMRDEAGAEILSDFYDLYDIMVDTVTIPPRSGNDDIARFERTYSFVDIPDANGIGRGLASTPFHAGGPPQHLLVSRYADSEAPVRYCFERAAEPPREADRALLARLGIIALAADDDFRPIASDEAYDSRFNRSILIAPAFSFNPRDWISASSDKNTTFLTWMESSDGEALVRERNRLLELLRTTCGRSSVTVAPPAEWQKPDEPTAYVTGFAPKAAMTIALALPRTRGTEGTSTPGYITFHFDRIPGNR